MANTNEIEDIAPIAGDYSLQLLQGFVQPGGLPPVVVQATLKIGIYQLRLINPPYEQIFPPPYQGLQSCWVYRIGSAASIIRLNPDTSPGKGSLLCMTRDDVKYAYDFDAYPPFRLTNLGQVNENFSSQYHPVEAQDSVIEIKVSAVSQKIQIHCDVLMEDDGRGVVTPHIGGGGVSISPVVGPYGTGRWQKRYESGILTLGAGNKKRKEILVQTTYLTQNPKLILEAVG